MSNSLQAQNGVRHTSAINLVFISCIEAIPQIFTYTEVSVRVYKAAFVQVICSESKVT